MSSATLHPIVRTFTPEQIQAAFRKVNFDITPDPIWHFQLVISRACQLAPAEKTVPQPGGPMVSLVLLHQPAPASDIEVFGQHLTQELDAADWLDFWLAEQNYEVLSRKRLETMGGAVGDVVARWQAGDTAWMGRLFACKAGPRLFLIWFRTAAADYARLADDFFLSISTFQVLDDRLGALAERVQWIGGALPIAWRVAIPVSWRVTEEPQTDRAASFQATLPAETATLPDSATDANVGTIMLAKLSLAVIAADGAAGVDDIFAKMSEALHDAGVTAETPVAQPEVTGPGYLHAWRAESAATVNGRPAEVRFRVLQHARAWVAALVVSPTPAQAPAIWMRSKRVLDIAIDTREIAAV